MSTFTLKIKEVKRDVLQATQEPFLDVEVEILDGEKVVETKKYGFAIDTPEEAIKSELKRMLDLYIAEIERALQEKDKDALIAQADKTAESLADWEAEPTEAETEEVEADEEAEQ